MLKIIKILLLDADFASFKVHRLMKNYCKKFILYFLVWLARIRLKRLRPFIIAITGSVGKTSTKEALYTILRQRYSVIRNQGSYNTDFGLPLAILEQLSGFSSPWKWLKIMTHSVVKAFWGGHKVQMMVLELGVDKPGDMDYLLKLIQPQIAIITNIMPVHLDKGQFKDEEDIFLEKSKLIRALPEKGIAILNGDDPYLAGTLENISCKKISYGMSETVDLHCSSLESSLEGLRFTLSYKEQVVSGNLPLLGRFQIYVILAAATAALTQGFSLEEAINALKEYRMPPGRMNVVPGILNTVIIDSSYNASPATMKEAMDILEQTAHGRKIAVLGNMNELGRFTNKYHRDIGRYAVGRADILITIGKYAKLIGEESQKYGFEKTSVFHSDDVLKAADILKKLLQKNDTVLVKGSQNNVRLERLVKILMKEPEQADKLLVRQEKEWLEKK